MSTATLVDFDTARRRVNYGRGRTLRTGPRPRAEGQGEEELEKVEKTKVFDGKKGATTSSTSGKFGTTGPRPKMI